MFRNLGPEGNSAFLQYNENEWRIATNQLLDLADGDCAKCEHYVAESDRLCHKFKCYVKQKEQDIDREFDLRIGDVDYWRSELDRQVQELQRVNDALDLLRTKMETFSHDCEVPIQSCQEIIVYRDERKGVDLVNDEAQCQIQKYLALLYDVKALLETNIDKNQEQVRVNKVVIQHIKKDIDDKLTALNLDETSQRTKKADVDYFLFNEDLLRPARDSFTISDWETWTIHNVARAQKEINRSDKYRMLLEQILREASLDLKIQRQKAIDALNDRIADLRRSQELLELRVSRLDHQLVENHKALDHLEKSVDDAIKMLELNETRMEIRRGRKRMELVRDFVDHQLETEVGELNRSILRMRDKIKEIQRLTREMESTKLGIEKQIEQKKNCIYIDQNKCLALLSLVAHEEF